MQVPADLAALKLLQYLPTNCMESQQNNLYFYNLQKQAPKPVPVINSESEYSNVDTAPPEHYGKVFHGLIERDVAESIVRNRGQGAYLVRESVRQPGQYTLVLQFDNEVKNFRLYFDGSRHYLTEEKMYSSINELVADGLICFYCEKYGREQIRQMTIPRKHKFLHQSEVVVRSAENNFNRSLHNSLYQEAVARSADDNFSGSFGHEQRKSVLDVKLERSGVLLSKNSSCSSLNSAALLLQGDTEGTFTAFEQVRSKHDFRVATFLAPNFCSVCNNYMWGLVSQGVKCSKCGMSIHKMCKEQVGDYCRPDRKLIKTILGCDLHVLCMAFKSRNCFVIQMCVAEVEAREGDQIEGIYRIGAGVNEVSRLAEEIERYQDKAQISCAHFPDIHTVATYLKKYLRSLPVPLVPFHVYESLLEIFKNGRQMPLNTKVEQVRALIRTLDVYYLSNLHLIIVHLSKIASQSHANKMTTANLGTIFGQCLLRSLSECLDQPIKSAQAFVEMPYQNECIVFLIENCANIF